MSMAKERGKPSLDVPAALHAICSTGIGRCWYCDRKLPREKSALRGGWDVQRLETDRVASIILVCPKCLRARAREGFLPLRPCDAAY